MSIKGFPLQQNTGLKQQYVTVNPAGKDKFGMDVLPKMLYPLSGVSPLTIQSYDPLTGTLEITAHGARVGDSLRFIGGANDRVEIPILEVIDADNVKIYSSAVDTIVALTDEVFVMRPINQTANEDGNLVVSVTPGPLTIEVDGTPTTVNVDTGTPANTVRVPVEVYSASGPINITAGDINVQLSDAGPNFDRTRIGDGTNQWGFNGSSEGLVHDASANAELDSQTALLTTIDADTGSIDAKLPALVGGRIPVDGSGVTQPVSGPLTDAELRASAVPVSMASAPLPTGAATEATLSALNAKVPSALGQQSEANSLSVTLSTENETDLQAIRTSLELVDDTIATNGGASLTKFQTVGGHTGTTSHAWHVDASGLGRVDVRASALPTGAATETTLASVDGKLPATLGQKTMANSFSVAIASDQSTLPVTPNVKAAVTVKQAAITVGTSAVRLTTDAAAPSSTRQKLVFQPISTSTANFYWGSSSVASSGANRGVQIFPGANEVFFDDANDYYIISDTAGQTVFVTEAE
jgi:hypothetical protein